MLLAIDIGNTAIKFGIFSDGRLVSRISIPTRRSYTAEEIEARVTDVRAFPIEDAIACSVVPQVEHAVENFVKDTLKVEPFFVRNNSVPGLKIRYEPVDAAGTDRLLNAYSAAQRYGKPCIACSFGTAATIDAVNAEGEFLGGVIAPGMPAMAKALHLAAAQLPEVEVEKPAAIIGTTTEDSIRSGIFFGQIGMIEGIVRRMKAELGGSPKVVATGGFVDLISAEASVIDIVDRNLLLEGLQLIFRDLHAQRETT